MTRTHILPALLVASLLLVQACSQQHGGRKNKEIHKVTVGVCTVSDVSSTNISNYVGEVTASKSAILSSRHSGILQSMDVRQGSRVDKGEALATIESKNVRSSYEMAMATLRQAEDGYERVRKVHESGTVPDVKMVEMETSLAKARALAESAAQALDECTVKAPFAGTISEVFAETGVDINPGSPLFRIVDISSLEVRIYVPEGEIGSLSIGQEADIDIPALGKKGIKASISSKGVTATALSHTYECYLKIRGDISEIMPGMVCKVSISDKNEARAIIIPASAVETDTKGRFVWLCDEGKVSKRFVSIGGYSGKGVIVTSGLESGDMVIVQGTDKVSTGMSVIPVETEW